MKDISKSLRHAEVLYSLGFYNVVSLQNCNNIRIDKSGDIIINFLITLKGDDDSDK